METQVGEPGDDWPYGVHGPAVSPDGRVVAVGDQDHRIHILDARTGAVQRSIQGTALYDGLRFNAAGTHVIAAALVARRSRAGLQAWEVASGRLAWQNPDWDLFAPTFNHAENLLFAVAPAGRLGVLDPATGAIRATLLGRKAQTRRCAAAPRPCSSAGRAKSAIARD